MKATKHYESNRVYVYLTIDERTSILSFANETEMRRAGQCLVDLARIGGNTVEIKDKKEKEK